MHWLSLASLASILLPTSNAQTPITPLTSHPKWQEATLKADALIAQMNLTEKSLLTTGNIKGMCMGNIVPIPRLNFTGICLMDGPASVRVADLVSVFPAGITTGATWDRELIYQRGVAMGAEFKDKGSHVILGPVTGPLGRVPLGGRNWEGFAVDPYLGGVATALSVQGIQDSGVQACTKHYIGNEQETQRSDTVIDGEDVQGISANIDDRTLHELYLWPFADAVRAGTLSIMCSYNRLNSTYACENSVVLNDILKNELGFQGYVMSDWFATHSGVDSVLGGLDMTMPGPVNTFYFEESYFGENLVAAVQNGNVSEERVDDMVRRILTPYYYLDQDDGFPTADPSTIFVYAATYGLDSSRLALIGVTPDMPIPPARDVRADHAALIRKIGSAGTVLLKNENSTLPLKTPANIAVFGSDAADSSIGSWEDNRHATFPNPGFEMGTLAIGGGSGGGRLSYIVSPLDAIKQRASQSNTRVQYITDNRLLAQGTFVGIYPVPEICLVFLKTYAEEGIDRASFELDWNSTAIVDQVSSFCPSTVVITHSPGVNTMPWATNPNVTAILAAHYPGQESGNSIADILFGDVNPSGRLPYTIAHKEEDYNTAVFNITDSTATDSSAWQDNFTEGLFIDYRDFDAKNITPLYEFGYGLSYTTFNLSSELNIQTNSASPSEYPAKTNESHPGGNPHLWDTLYTVTTTVSNTGDLPGATVIQLYISLPQDTTPSGTPVKVLRGFEKVYLSPGEKREVSFSLTRRDLSFWDVGAQDWRIPGGEAIVRVGFSSRDIKGEGALRLVRI